jgi:predicted CXXCH cytochrome family protein
MPMKITRAAVVVTTLALVAVRPALAAGPDPLERRLGRQESLRLSEVPHPHAEALTKGVLATMGPGSPWDRFRDPADGRRYVGPDACAPCHPNWSAAWVETKMASAFSTLAGFSGGAFLNDRRCLSCHTTGYDPGRDNGGFDEGAPLMADVGCEACHGAGSLMIERQSRAYIVRSLDAALCGRCHGERYGAKLCFPEYDEWKISRHARSLESVKRTPGATDDCLGCHSVEGIVPSPPRDAAVATATLGVTCQACHDAMTRTRPDLADNNQLRKPKDELCRGCHSDRKPAPDGLPHSPQDELFRGFGGAHFPGESYPAGPMNADLPRGCLSCHGIADRSGDRPFQGHAFLPDIMACRKCHPDLTTFDRKGVQGTVRELLIRLEAALAAVPESERQGQAYRMARHNYLFVLRDRSLGIHNTTYARKLLADSLRRVTTAD